MSALLRSAKFLRLITGVARNFSACSRTDGESFVGSHRQVWYGLDTRSLSSQALPRVTSHSVDPTASSHSIEKVLSRLDFDARRWGRVQRTDVDEIYSEIKNAGVITSSQALLLLRCCGSLISDELPAERTKLVQNIWDTLTALGIKLDISHYNALLRVYIENEHEFSPADFLAYLRSQNVTPNRVTFQRLIYRYCLLGDINGATQILGHMKKNDMAINEDTFNSLIIGHARANDLESAKSMLAMMQRANLEPSPETYRHLACGHVACGDAAGVQRVMQMAIDAGTPLTGRDQLELIYSLTLAGQHEQAEQLLGELKRNAIHNFDVGMVLSRLIYSGHHQMAFRLLALMVSPSNDAGFTNFFVRHIVRNQLPPDTIVDYCDRLASQYGNDQALLLALYRSLHAPVQRSLARHLLTVFGQRQLTLRQYYFWPLIADARANANYDDVLDVLRLMMSLDVFVSVDTLVEQVFPTCEHLHVPLNRLLDHLNKMDVSYGHTAHALCRYYLKHSQLQKAAATAKRFTRVPLNSRVVITPLVHAFCNSGDIESTIYLLRRVYETASDHHTTDTQSEREAQAASTDADATETADTATDTADAAAVKAMSIFVESVAERVSVDRLQALCEAMLECGLRVSRHCVTAVQAGSDQCTDRLSDVLHQLSDQQLQLQQLPAHTQTAGRSITSSKFSALNEEMAVNSARSSGEDLVRPLTRLLLRLLYINNMTQAAVVKQELEQLQSPLPLHVLERWCRGLVFSGRLDEALAAFAALVDTHSQHVTDQLTLSFAHLMLKQGHKQETLKLLSDHPHCPGVTSATAAAAAAGDGDEMEQRTRHTDPDNDFSSHQWGLVNLAAEAGDVALVRQLLHALEDNGYCSHANRALMSLLIKAFIVSGDLEGAVSEVESLAESHRYVFNGSLLMKSLISADKPELLQRCIEVSTRIKGELDALYELAIAFIECGKFRQGQKIMQTPGLRPLDRRLNSACERMASDGRLQQLEQLVASTRHIHGLNRRRLYWHLMCAHCAAPGVPAAHAALAVWTRMQEEDVVPSDEMLAQLAYKLRQHGLPVPFDVPDVTVPDTVPATAAAGGSGSSSASHDDSTAGVGSIYRLKRTLKANHLDQALDIERSITQHNLAVIQQRSILIHLLLKAGRAPDAVAVCHQMLDTGCYPERRSFQRLLSHLAQAGMLSELEALVHKMSPEVRAQVPVDGALCEARIVSGQGEAQLADWQQFCQQLQATAAAAGAAGDGDRESDFQSVSARAFITALQHMPDQHDRCFKLAADLAAQGVIEPVNACWTYLMTSGDYQRAHTLYQQYFARLKHFHYRAVLDNAVATSNKEMVLQVLQMLRSDDQTAAAAPGKSRVPALISLLKISEKQDDISETNELFASLGLSSDDIQRLRSRTFKETEEV